MTNFHLKLLALTTMLIDHVGAILFPQYIILRIIGRISFPIYCFLLVEGYIHTHNFKKYILRIGLLALISELPYDLVFHEKAIFIYSQNIFFTLFIGLLAVHSINYFKNKKFIIPIIIFILCFIAYIIKCDYGYIGVLIIIGFYIFKTNFMNLVLFQLMLLFPFHNIANIFRILALIPIFFYNEKKGYNIKYLFYPFYPLHLLILYLITYFIKF